jgi:hypothetical protein
MKKWNQDFIFFCELQIFPTFDLAHQNPQADNITRVSQIRTKLGLELKNTLRY